MTQFANVYGFFLSRYSVLTSSVFLQWSSVPFGAAEHASGFLIFKGPMLEPFSDLYFLRKYPKNDLDL